MRKLVVNGARPLFGNVRVGGSKNAALPILFATLATGGTSVIKNAPDIGDVRCTLDILRGFGAEITKCGKTLTVCTDRVQYKRPCSESVSAIRASTYLIGSCLSRFGICHLQEFGGCNFSSRPIDFHIRIAEQMGGMVDDCVITADKLCPCTLTLPKPSVGATVNALIMASGADGVTKIIGAAKEPHIMSLIDFLRSAGAEITVDEDILTVKGGRLHGGNISLIGDMIEAGTYLAMSVATGGDITVIGVNPEELAPFASALRTAGASVWIKNDSVRAYGSLTLPFDILCAPYPAFPTDLQPIMAALSVIGAGGVIRDTVFPERFGYLSALYGFGAKYKTVNDTAYIYKGRSLSPSEVKAPDLRGGAACIILALSALGKSTVSGFSVIERGYENIVKKLRMLGADVKISNSR